MTLKQYMTLKTMYKTITKNLVISEKIFGF